ncbi:hypothetical protein GCM10011352_28550 [Marinobacterium zhoushanense]|uniref:Membrane protein YkvI n=1 Tax=Marinobacterium zhoushanense TaxID=1679163 RepID=A0ABQ1KJU1_9GAMM|nr:hypothetical protein [Marinobacterium zhoushanense]GGC00687.1 hypothetical protein GCM10011352_28550 [Marinobacterium zhoushanense]
MVAGDFTFLDAFLVLFSLVVAAVMLRRRVRDAPFWRATVTPLASIIGSGFLVVAPLLAHIGGVFASLDILIIVLLSLWLGSAIRFNILHDGTRSVPEVRSVRLMEHLSDLALAAAYVVSVAFYIRLLCGFVLTGLGVFTVFNADVLATLLLVFIGIYGLRRGLSGLERLEEYSVTIKLAIIASLILGLIAHDSDSGYSLAGLESQATDPWERLRMLGGMLLIVQGFETSKYLEGSYTPVMRARSMWLAQIVAGTIYIVFVVLALPLMAHFAQASPSETAIIDLSRHITLILPLMLVVAAAMSQFSAAIADTIGAGGVVEQESRQRVSAKPSYLVITLLAATLIWFTNIFEVVALASRAFAFYYCLQAIQAARLAAATASGRRRRWLIASYLVLALLMITIVLFAKPVED